VSSSERKNTLSRAKKYNTRAEKNVAGPCYLGPRRRGEERARRDLKSGQDYSESQDNAMLQGNEVLSQP